MSALHKHIGKQQALACNLCGILEALSVLDNEDRAPGTVTSLFSVARMMAEDLNQSLDSVNLPKGDGA